MIEEQKLTANEAINEFYRLKDLYETTRYELVKPILKQNKSKREKRVELSRLPKTPCVNCQRNVGTIFSIKCNTDNYIKMFTAKCGDLNDPCPLDIQIQYSMRETYESMIEEGIADIERIKLEIIKQKNDTLFFKDRADVVSVFENLTEQLKISTENTGLAIETNILINENPAKLSLIRKLVDEFGKEMIIPFKQRIREFMEENNEMILNQAVRFYVDEMVPKLKEIQELKYGINFVEYDKMTDLYSLIQRNNTLQDREHALKSDDKVLKFILGLRKVKPAGSTKSTNNSIDNEINEIPSENEINEMNENENEIPSENEINEMNEINENVQDIEGQQKMSKELAPSVSVSGVKQRLNEKLLLQNATEALEEEPNFALKPSALEEQEQEQINNEI